MAILTAADFQDSWLGAPWMRKCQTFTSRAERRSPSKSASAWTEASRYSKRKSVTSSVRSFWHNRSERNKELAAARGKKKEIELSPTPFHSPAQCHVYYCRCHCRPRDSRSSRQLWYHSKTLHASRRIQIHWVAPFSEQRCRFRRA